jgi:tetratricopeptide (TPR) repeat protein
MYCTKYAALLIAVGLAATQGQRPGTSTAPIESLIRSREYDHALEATKSELKEAPNDFRLWTLEGIVFSLKGSNSDALTAFENALRLSPTYMPALKGAVQLFYSTGDLRAIPLLERILKAEPADLTAQEMLAILEKKKGDCKIALDHFAVIADIIGTHPESLEADGYCLAQMKRFQEAIPVFEELAALLPEQTFPKYDLAVVLVAAKQNDAALKVLEPLLTDDQRDPDILSVASEAYEATGDTPKSVALLRQAIVLSPATVDYYLAFASICLDHDSFQVGIDMIDAGLKYIAGDPALYVARGLLYAQLAQFDRAEADFDTAEHLNPAQSIGSYAGDLAELQKNDPDQALARVRSQLKAHPESPLLHYLLAELLENQAPPMGSAAYNEALRSALLAVKMKPDFVSARDLLAGVYIRSGQYDLAIAQSRLALQSSPSDETATYHLLIALRRSGHGDSDEIKTLVKHISEMHQASLHEESERKKYRLVEQDTPPSN